MKKFLKIAGIVLVILLVCGLLISIFNFSVPKDKDDSKTEDTTVEDSNT